MSLQVVVDRDIPFLKGVLEPFADVVYLSGKDIDASSVKKADALLIRTRTRCDRSLLEHSRVQMIGSASIGYDHIDTEYCDHKGIRWHNAPGCNAGSVGQYLAAALLQIAEWDSFRLRDKTIGIIGVGNVGKRVERFAGLLGMKILLNDPPRERMEGSGLFVPLEYLLQESDLITLHVPLTMDGPDRTFHLINRETLPMTLKKPWIINTSRGKVADSMSLISHSARGSLSGLVLDVWEHEPILDEELLRITDIATFHIAGYSVEGKANATAAVVNQLAVHFDLPLKDWHPENLPIPVQETCTIDAIGKDPEDILSEAIKHSYRIMEDDALLRNDPASFEILRDHYRIRREFPAYLISLFNGSETIKNLLQNTGFRITDA